MRYHWAAEEYRQSSGEQAKWADELMSKLDLAADEHVLDIGCGDGKVAYQLARLARRGFVLGVDNSPEMIRLARRTYPPDKHDNLRFQVQDARRLDFHQEFHLVFSNAALHWIVDHRPVLTGIKQSLKPKGRGLLQMGGVGNAAQLIDVIKGVMSKPSFARFFRDFSFPYGFYGPEEYRIWLAEAGLKPVRVDFVPKDMVHKGREGLAAWIRTTWLPYTCRVPGNLRATFIDDIVDEFLTRFPPDVGGSVHVAMVRLEVECEA